MSKYIAYSMTPSPDRPSFTKKASPKYITYPIFLPQANQKATPANIITSPNTAIFHLSRTSPNFLVGFLLAAHNFQAQNKA